jgi:predicted site-specific integrase-resolvase
VNFLGEWMTLAQAATVLGITKAELRPLHQSGDITVTAIRPGVWRVDARSVTDLMETPAWKARAAS